MATHVIITQPLVEISAGVSLYSGEPIELGDNPFLECLHMRNAANGTTLIHMVRLVA